MGAAAMKTSCWTVFKTLNLNLLVSEIENNARDYYKITNVISNNDTELNNEVSGISQQINLMLSRCNERLTQIVPSRAKRAIFSPLGSVIKLITGNLDNEDAIKYNMEINNLKNEEHSVVRKMSLIQVAMDNFVNISDNLNFNAKQLNLKTQELESIVYKENKMLNIFHVVNSMFQILNNFRTILNMIQEMETAIAFSKIHVLHQSIINSTELFRILETINLNNNLIYNLTKDNLIKIERSITFKSYMDNNKLVFVLEIPLVEKDTYNYYKIIPIPIYDPVSNKTFAIIPQYPYLLVKRLKYRPVINPCEELEKNKYLCSMDNLAPVPVETCIEQIMSVKTNLTKCHKYPVHIENTRIQQICNSHWLIYSKEDVTITEDCADEVQNYHAKGTYLMRSNNNKCKIQIGDIHINSATSSKVMFQLSTVQLPEVYQPIQPREEHLDLRDIDLSDIRQIVKSVKNSGIRVDNYIVNKISVWTLSLYIFILSTVLIFGFYKMYVKFLQKVINKNSQKPTESSSENFSFGEGGVKCYSPNTIPFVSH